jgi:hypothetical protein
VDLSENGERWVLGQRTGAGVGELLQTLVGIIRGADVPSGPVSHSHNCVVTSLIHLARTAVAKIAGVGVVPPCDVTTSAVNVPLGSSFSVPLVVDHVGDGRAEVIGAATRDGGQQK